LTPAGKNAERPDACITRRKSNFQILRSSRTEQDEKDISASTGRGIASATATMRAVLAERAVAERRKDRDGSIGCRARWRRAKG